MPKTWQTVSEAEVDATPDQVWQAIATGPGLDGWFSGSNEIQPGPSGVLHSTTAGFSDDLSVTGWEPPQRVAYRSSQAEGGRFYALEWLVEGSSGATVLRCVASGFIPGDDWEAEFESLQAGGAMYFQSLVQYLTYFRGRTALVVDAFGPPCEDAEQAWQVLTGALGLAETGAIKVGDQVRLTPTGCAPIEGVAYATEGHMLAIRASDGLYRFLRAGPMSLVSHRIFSTDAPQQQTEEAWQGWLGQLFA